MAAVGVAKKTSPHSLQKGGSPRRKRKRRKFRIIMAIIVLTVVIIVLLALAAAYYLGYKKYQNKFTANTYVNGIDVSELSMDDALLLFEHSELPETIDVLRPSGDVVSIKLSAIDYEYDYAVQLQKIYDDLDKKSWFAYLFKDSYYKFTDSPFYDEDKLYEMIENSDWGDIENQSADLKSDDDGYYVVEEVQGDEFDMDVLKSYIKECLDKGIYTMNGIDSGAYIKPETVAEDYDEKLQTLNELWDLSITFDFDYTTETLTGKKLCQLFSVKRDGSYTIKEDKCMEYVEKLADKYDTYNTERNFHATLQGDIVVPTSDDAKYGWWIDQEETCSLLVEMLEKGESVESVDPIYYESGSYVFTGKEDARTADDDIGNTYVEIDLTAQHFWYYLDGELQREGDIVSGQTTSAARTTLPGVYKVWYKATNYKMKGENADGETWESTCNYWTRVAIVGIGLHDTTTRTAFGGNIYKYNGSHGCINMTLSDAKYIYENVEMNTPVVMYY